jgi:hypothetical protein
MCFIGANTTTERRKTPPLIGEMDGGQDVWGANDHKQNNTIT